MAGSALHDILAHFRAAAHPPRELGSYFEEPIRTDLRFEPGYADFSSPRAEDYRVVKIKFAKTWDPETGKSINDKTTVIYNDRITIRSIPLEAYEYVVNGKPALEWVMERQAVTKDKDSGIVNDANLWATETMGNPKYPLELFLRVIRVSLETNRIVAALPELKI
jgi:predicted helicase